MVELCKHHLKRGPGLHLMVIDSISVSDLDQNPVCPTAYADFMNCYNYLPKLYPYFQRDSDHDL